MDHNSIPLTIISVPLEDLKLLGMIVANLPGKGFSPTLWDILKDLN
jgi:hypothetical protein